MTCDKAGSLLLSDLIWDRGMLHSRMRYEVTKIGGYHRIFSFNTWPHIFSLEYFLEMI